MSSTSEWAATNWTYDPAKSVNSAIHPSTRRPKPAYDSSNDVYILSHNRNFVTFPGPRSACCISEILYRYDAQLEADLLGAFMLSGWRIWTIVLPSPDTVACLTLTAGVRHTSATHTRRAHMNANGTTRTQSSMSNDSEKAIEMQGGYVKGGRVSVKVVDEGTARKLCLFAAIFT
eukprot:3683471-Pleurochrysis_carterae.AAC.1